jgi:putative phage-type endonuclease
MLEIIKPENERHWLALRKKFVSSTESAALFDMSPYLSKFELYHEKKDPDLVEFSDNERMEIGRDMEAAIAKHALKKLGARGRANKDYYCDKDTGMGSSYDWYISVSKKYKGHNLEIKNVDGFIFRQEWDVEGDEMPEHIEVQVQHQMHMNGAPGCVVAAMVGGNKLYLFYRKYNPEVGQAIEEAIIKFWEDVDNDNEPDPCYYDDADMVIKLNSAAGEKVYDASQDEMIKRLVQECKEVNTIAAEIDRVKKAKKAELFDAIGPEFNKVTFDNWSVSCGQTKGTPDVTITKEMANEMIGTTKKGRSGFRQCRITVKKLKEEKVNAEH